MEQNIQIQHVEKVEWTLFWHKSNANAQKSIVKILTDKSNWILLTMRRGLLLEETENFFSRIFYFIPTKNNWKTSHFNWKFVEKIGEKISETAFSFQFSADNPLQNIQPRCNRTIDHAVKESTTKEKWNFEWAINWQRWIANTNYYYKFKYCN